MAKHKNSVVARAESAVRRELALVGLVGRSVAALDAEGARRSAELNVGCQRTLQLVSTEGQFSALIKHGNKTFQFDGDSFAVTTHD